MSFLRSLWSDERVRWACGVGLALAVGAAWIAWQSGVTLAEVKESWERLNGVLAEHPSWLFWALVLLPALPIPTSALLVTAGVVWRDRPVMACVLSVLAIGLNLSWTYWLAAGPARKLVEKTLSTSSFKVPQLPENNHLKLVLILKLTPAIPFFIQNYLCGFLRAPFRIFLPVSLLCNGIIGTGIVLGGAGLADGKLMPAITGVCLIAVSVVLTQLLRNWLAKRRSGGGVVEI